MSFVKYTPAAGQNAGSVPVNTEVATHDRALDSAKIQDVHIDNQPAIQFDAGGRQRMSQITTLFDGKNLGFFHSLLWDVAGTGTGTFSANKYNMSVTAGQWYLLQSHRYFPYFSGKDQIIEETFDGFGLEAGVTKRFGYFSSSATSPFTATLDGLWIENDGTTYHIKTSRAGTETTSVAFADWDNYALLSSYNFNNFTVFFIDFLWLGGAVMRVWVKTDLGFILAHTVNYAGSAPDVFMLSPNQPVRYEIRSTTGTGSFRYICSQVGTEGSIDESGTSRAVDIGNTAVTFSTIGTTYPVKAIRKQAAYRDIAVIVEDIEIFVTSTQDNLRWSLQINPTLSAGLTYTAVSNSAVEEASGNGTITVTTPGTVIARGGVLSGLLLPNHILEKNFLSWLGGTPANVMDQYVLCVTPMTNACKLTGGLAYKAF